MLGALVLVQVFFGVHYVVAKQLLDWIDPAAWAVLRIGTAAVLLLAWLAGRRAAPPRRAADWLLLAGFACCGVVVNQICFVEGLARTTPAHSSLIATTIPLWTLAIAVGLRREALSARRVAGLALAATGVAILLRADRFHVEGDLLAGDLLIVVNSASYGLFLVVSKRYLAEHDPLSTVAWVFALGTLGVGAYGLDEVVALDFGALPAAFWWSAAFIVLFPTIGSYFLNYWALRRVTSSLVALFIYLQPVIATALDGAWRGNWPSARFYPAAILVLGGVALGLRPGRSGAGRAGRE